MTKRHADPSAMYRSALQHFEKRRYAQARSLLLELHRALPKETDVLRALGAVCSETGRHDEAVGYFLRVVELRPMALDFFNLGKALQLRGEFGKALWAHETGLNLDPSNLQLLQGRATTLAQLGRDEDAIAAYRVILKADPTIVEARYNFAETLLKVGEAREALVHLAFADRAEPGMAGTVAGLVRAKLTLCDWQGLSENRLRLIEAVKAGARAHPFTLLTVSDDPDVHLKAARSWMGATEDGEPRAAFSNRHVTPGKLRIAYVSADFRKHATSYLIAGMLEAHDRSKVETIAISTGRDDASDMRRRIEAAADRFVDVRGQSAPEIVTRMREMDIHVAVDLMGHTTDSNDMIFRLRAAPVQVNFLGYPGTSAIAAMDYIVADRFIATARVRRCLTEAPIVMPHCYQPNDPQRPRPAPAIDRPAHGLPEGRFVFCCFNNTGKITPETFDAWMRTLLAVSGSVLWLYVPDETTGENLTAAAAVHGIGAERLVFAPAMDHERHLARYGLADLFLDTFPYSAHTTASDALWMGCPVLTLAGESFPSRVAGSLLQTVGLPDLIATTLEAYVQTAIALSQDPQRLEGYRRHLDAVRSSTPLFDAALFAKDLERAYHEIWRRYQAGSKPRAVEVAELGEA